MVNSAASLDGFNLFDLKNDPNEMKSVHDHPEYVEVLANMKKSLETMRSHCDLPPRHGEKK